MTTSKRTVTITIAAACVGLAALLTYAGASRQTQLFEQATVQPRQLQHRLNRPASQ